MEPWLDSLSEDWKSDHHSSSPAPSLSSLQKRGSIVSSRSQSRIPHLAQNIRKDSTGGYLRPRSTRGLAKSRTEPILTERSASSLNVPPPHAGSQKRLSASTLPRRASTAFSDSLNSVQHNTIHERPNDADTPEWKRRLANGEDIVSDGFDLFAPSKLEGIFKEPTLKSDKENENSLIDTFSKPWKPLDLSSAPSLNEQFQSLRASRSRPAGMEVLEEVDEDALDKHELSAISSDVVRDGSIRGIVQRRVQSLERVKHADSNHSSPGSSRPTSAGLDTTNDPRWRTVSGRKELEDEFISPVTASRQNTIRDQAVKDSLDMDVEALDQKLAELGVMDTRRPSSSSSDRQVSYGHDEALKEDLDLNDDLGDMTSQSLPDDLSMGTQDFITQGGYINRRRGGPSNEASFLKRALSSTDHSQLDSKLKQTFRSSPPPYPPSRNALGGNRPASPLPPCTPQDESVVHHDHPVVPTSSGSPLKLFGNRDTYTNNKLMRILSHFDESALSEEDKQSEASPMPEQNVLRLSKFGEGDLDNFDFEFEKQVSPVHSRPAQEPSSNIFAEPTFPRQGLSNSETQPEKGTRHRDGGKGGQPPTPLRSPKRRRTLLKGEIAVDDRQLEISVAQIQDLNQLAGTKRKDARPGDAGAQAEPDVLATRMRLQPKSAREASVTSVDPLHIAPEGNEDKIQKDQDMTEALAAELASFAHEAAETRNDSRKPSLATKDYMEEANKVMEFIRARGRPKPKLSDIDEPVNLSELDPDKILDLEIDDESTQDEFSRPPSRERPVKPPPDRRHAVHDPKTASYLRKYKDDDDLELLANISGLGTLRVADNEAAEEASHVPIPEDSNPDEQESSPPNMRILNADQSRRKRKHSASTVEEQKDTALQVQTHTHSSNNSTQKTFPTSSSSGNRGMITSATVSIPDQIGTMTFDHQLKTWVKVKCSTQEDQSHTRKEPNSSTEDDPFANIPDLSIDEKHEEEVKTGSCRSTLEAGAKNCKPVPVTQDFATERHTRAAATTSVVDTGKKRKLRQRNDEHWPTDSSFRSEISKHEARLHDGLTSRAPNSTAEDKRQVRAVTIAFSSPLVSAVKYPQEPDYSDIDLDEEVDLPLDDSEESLTPRNQRKAAHSMPTPQHTPVSKEHDERYEQYRAMTLNRRPVSRIDEQDEEELQVELSLIHVKQSQELTPAPNQKAMVKAQLGKNRNSSILCLTPLSEFSVHQIDDLKHPEESFVAQRANPKTIRQAHGPQALSVDALVKAITDAAPTEIYWEHIRTLRLENKGLTSLQSLNEYCSSLEELSLVGNEIPHLNGLPRSLRVLDFQHNALTSLASWGKLHNLQYVDVSGNQLENLDCFGCLVHLRKLVANDNHIRNIDGVTDLGGLLELDVRGNELIDVDFEGCELVRLNKLHLGANKLRSIRNLQRLTSLEELDLSHNQLCDLAETNLTPKSLRVLDASHNQFETFDLGRYPGIKVVNLDSNKLKAVSGLETAYGLESISLRTQRAISELVSQVLSVPNECRSIYLSSNLVPGGCFELPALAQCNLRELELSGCGISELPHGFGNLFPNCRKLNLNFNGISEFSVLRGMDKLSVLGLARNRIKRLRRTCLLLSRLRALTKLDLRDNPLTVGFYPPPQPQTTSVESGPQEHYDLMTRCAEKDLKWSGLLDETTRLRRQTTELLLAETCSNLSEVDGAEFKGASILKLDHTWDSLTKKGVLVKPAPVPVEESENTGLGRLSPTPEEENETDVGALVDEPSLMVE